jgi:sulfate/thiosulfate transport system permease protein
MHLQRSSIPGLRLSLGYTVFYLSLIVLLPLSATIVRTSELSFSQFWTTITSARALASYRLTFGAAFLAASVNAIGGLLVAWTLTRFRFPGRRLLDAIIDLPFALPTAVAGIALTTLYAPYGWLGSWFRPFGINISYAVPGVILAMAFVGLPFVVRTVQPVIENLNLELEEAATSLGANARQTFFRVLIPELLPSLVTGFTLAFARALGEYGSVVFISGNIPMKTEITPLLIMSQLEEYRYENATALAVVMLAVSFGLLLLINKFQRWSNRAI